MRRSLGQFFGGGLRAGRMPGFCGRILRECLTTGCCSRVLGECLATGFCGRILRECLATGCCGRVLRACLTAGFCIGMLWIYPTAGSCAGMAGEIIQHHILQGTGLQSLSKTTGGNAGYVLDKISKYCSTRIVYRFGGRKEILDGNTVADWIQYDPDTDTLSLDHSRMQEYVAGLAEKYDTYQRPREFQTSMGDRVIVEGGSYGWLLDQSRETELLEHYVRSGASREHTPKFAHTAADWSHSDLGDTYVEIDLTNQHVWLYVDGVEELSVDCVSGTYHSGRRTPEGTYTISSMESPAVLRGVDWNSPVSYWMPFNGGIGLHDATWRSSFGGDIYLYSGSHGCVNLPLWAAEKLYSFAYPGMPVICYYRE